MPSEGLHSLAGICRFPLLSTLPFQATQLRLGLRLQVTVDRFELSLHLATQKRTDNSALFASL